MPEAGTELSEAETHAHQQMGLCFQGLAALFFCLFGPFCLILGMASPADLFVIRHHLWVSRGVLLDQAPGITQILYRASYAKY